MAVITTLIAASLIQAVLRPAGPYGRTILTNTSSDTLHVDLDGGAVSTDTATIVPPLAAIELPAGDVPAITGRWGGTIPTGNAVLSEFPMVETDSADADNAPIEPERIAVAARATMPEYATQLRLLAPARDDRALAVTKTEVRVQKANTIDTKGFVTLIFVKAVRDDGTFDVLYFGGQSWDGGKSQSINSDSTIDFHLAIDDAGELPRAWTTGEVDAVSFIEDDTDMLTAGLQVPNARGETHTVGVGDLLIGWRSYEASGDRSSITAQIEYRAAA